MFNEWVMGAGIAFAICALIVVTKRFHMAHSARETDTGAVQAAHSVPTPRIGGVAWFGAIVIMMIFASLSVFDVPIGSGWIYLVSTLPVFVTGLAEDVTRKVSARARYMAAVVSGGLAIVMLGFWIDRIDGPGLSFLVGLVPVGVMLTLFVTASYAHAFNLIDGVNGLSSGVAVVGGLALLAMTTRLGLEDLGWLITLQVAALFGFILWNFPAGKIFLGDAGAYSIGHLMAWSALGIYAASPAVTCWALLLVFFWPLADTLYAMVRRVSAGKAIDTADRMHFHHVVMRGLEIRWLGRSRRRYANPLATLVILPLASIPAFFGVIYMDRPLAAFVALVLCGAGYVVLYSVVLAGLRYRQPLGLFRVMLRGEARRLRQVVRH